MEESNRILADQFRAIAEKNTKSEAELRKLAKRYEDLSKKLEPKSSKPSASTGEASPGGSTSPSTLRDEENANDASNDGGEGARDNLAGVDTKSAKDKGKPKKTPLKANFGPGFEFQTEDEEFLLQIHNMTQVEARIYQQGGQQPVSSGFFVPRERFYFTGRITKPIEYMASINLSYGNVNLLDAFLNFHYDDRLQIKLGRMKAPYTYEFYALSVQDLIAPERSLFSVNYSLNRSVGAMAWGQLFEKRLDYAVGTFDGPRNSFINLGNSLDVMAYLNARPFEKAEALPALKFLNVGGSVDFGDQSSPAIPQVLRTSAISSTNLNLANVSPSFLALNNNVTENGERALWSLHAAYYYKGLSLLAEWDSGFINYRRTARSTRTPIPVSGYFAQASYFLTGETVERRTQVKPLRPFDVRKGKFGPGAWELAARYSDLRVGQEVFDKGLADPNLWTNQAYSIDVGLNWYLNSFVKVYFDWQHVEFGQPVLYNTSKRQINSDLFWIRAQLYF